MLRSGLTQQEIGYSASAKPLARKVRNWIGREWRNHSFIFGGAFLVLAAAAIAAVMWRVGNFAHYIEAYALVVSVVGFAVAIAEIQHAESVEEGSKRAVDRSRRNRRRRELASAIQELPERAKLVEEVHSAMEENPGKVEALRIFTDDWAKLARRASALAQSHLDLDPPIRALELAIDKADETGQQIRGDQAELDTTGPQFVEAMREVSVDLDRFGERLDSLEDE